MADFVRQRGLSLALVVLVMSVDAIAQVSISYTFAFGELRGLLGLDVTLARIGYVTRIGIVALMAVLWLLERRRALLALVIVVNAYATLILLLHTGLLASVLAGLSFRAINQMFLDIVLMGISNMLVFSIWYWIVDPPGVEGEQRPGERWAFLFPQRASALPNFEGWQPRYADYLFLAFTTSFAFSPTDTLPLTRAAKMLMLLQATISIVTLTGIAGSAINILAGAAARP